MRKLGLYLFIALFSAPAWAVMGAPPFNPGILTPTTVVAGPAVPAAPAYVSSNGANGTGAVGVIINFTGSTNGAYGCARISGDISMTVSDPTPRKWTTISDTKDSSNNHLVLSYSTGPFTGSVTITATPASGTPANRFIVHEISNLKETGTVDASTSNAVASGNPATASFNTTATNTMIAACAAVTGTEDFTAGSGFTERQEIVQKISSEDKTVSSAGANTASYTLSLGGASVIAGVAFAGQN